MKRDLWKHRISTPAFSRATEGDLENTLPPPHPGERGVSFCSGFWVSPPRDTAVLHHHKGNVTSPGAEPEKGKAEPSQGVSPRQNGQSDPRDPVSVGQLAACEGVRASGVGPASPGLAGERQTRGPPSWAQTSARTVPSTSRARKGREGSLLGSGASMVDTMMGAPVRRATFW